MDIYISIIIGNLIVFNVFLVYHFCKIQQNEEKHRYCSQNFNEFLKDILSCRYNISSLDTRIKFIEQKLDIGEYDAFEFIQKKLNVSKEEE